MSKIAFSKQRLHASMLLAGFFSILVSALCTHAYVQLVSRHITAQLPAYEGEVKTASRGCIMVDITSTNGESVPQAVVQVRNTVTNTVVTTVSSPSDPRLRIDELLPVPHSVSIIVDEKKWLLQSITPDEGSVSVASGSETCTSVLAVYEERIENEPNIFTDLEDGSDEARMANALYNMHITSGVSEGVYGWNQSLNRAMIAKFIVTSKELPLPDGRPASVGITCWDAIEGEWYFPYLMAAVQYGIMQGYPDQSCRAGQSVTRSEAIALLSRAFNLPQNSMEDVAEVYVDVPQDATWFGERVLWFRHVFVAPLLQPSLPATRGETAKILYGILADKPEQSVLCGNGKTEIMEECDDGNLQDGDGCSATCKLEKQVQMPLCGNGVIDDGEMCDDGNENPSDGCGNSCIPCPVPGCVAPPPNCRYVQDSTLINGCPAKPCGILECEAVNISSAASSASSSKIIETMHSECRNDSCVFAFGPGPNTCMQDADCRRNSSSVKSAEKQEQLSLCGNGTIDDGEQCDDGQSNANTCTAANGAYCRYCSKKCQHIVLRGGRCGDGKPDPGEQCDDMNLRGGDGCSAQCTVESNYTCVEQRCPAGLVCKSRCTFAASPQCIKSITIVGRTGPNDSWKRYFDSPYNATVFDKDKKQVVESYDEVYVDGVRYISIGAAVPVENQSIYNTCVKDDAMHEEGWLVRIENGAVSYINLPKGMRRITALHVDPSRNRIYGIMYGSCTTYRLGVFSMDNLTLIEVGPSLSSQIFNPFVDDVRGAYTMTATQDHLIVAPIWMDDATELKKVPFSIVSKEDVANVTTRNIEFPSGKDMPLVSTSLYAAPSAQHAVAIVRAAERSGYGYTQIAYSIDAGSHTTRTLQKIDGEVVVQSSDGTLLVLAESETADNRGRPLAYMPSSIPIRYTAFSIVDPQQMRIMASATLPHGGMIYPDAGIVSAYETGAEMPYRVFSYEKNTLESSKTACR